MVGTRPGIRPPKAPISAQLPMLAQAAGAMQSRTAPIETPNAPASSVRRRPEPSRHPIAKQADADHSQPQCGGMQAHGPIAELELGLEERNDVALDVEQVGEEAQQQIAIPSGRIAPDPLPAQCLDGDRRFHAPGRSARQHPMLMHGQHLADTAEIGEVEFCGGKARALGHLGQILPQGSTIML